MLSTGQDEFLVGTQNGMCIRFHEDDVRPMGRTATGVRSILLDEGDQVWMWKRSYPARPCSL